MSHFHKFYPQTLALANAFNRFAFIALLFLNYLPAGHALDLKPKNITPSNITLTPQTENQVLSDNSADLLKEETSLFSRSTATALSLIPVVSAGHWYSKSFLQSGYWYTLGDAASLGLIFWGTQQTNQEFSTQTKVVSLTNTGVLLTTAGVVSFLGLRILSILDVWQRVQNLNNQLRFQVLLDPTQHYGVFSAQLDF